MTEERVKQIEERLRLRKELSTKENIIKKFQEKQEVVDDHCTWEVRHETITGLVEFVNPNKELAPCFDSRYYSLNECYVNPKDNELHVSPMSIGGVLFGPYPDKRQLKEYNDSVCQEGGKIKCIHLADGSVVLPANN